MNFVEGGGSHRHHVGNSNKHISSSTSPRHTTNHGSGSSRDVDFSDVGLADRRQEHEHHSLFAKVLLHSHVGPQKLSAHLAVIWHLRGMLRVVTLENDFFHLKFSDPLDLQKAIRGGPWMIDGRYITLRRWSPNFKPSSAFIDHIKVWIRLPGLPVEYYDKIALSRIAEAVGNLVRIDPVTENIWRCKFARLRVEIDPSLPLVSHLKLDGGFMQPIQYEGIEVVCYHCGRVGHFKEDCSSTSNTYGPWLHVPPARRRQHQHQHQQPQPGTGVFASGSGNHSLEQENIPGFKDDYDRNLPKIPSMNPAPIGPLKEECSFVRTESTRLIGASSSTSNSHGSWIHVPPRRQTPPPAVGQQNVLRMDDYEHNFPKIHSGNPAVSISFTKKGYVISGTTYFT